jgi:AraC-like DNA-binding protein
MACPMLHSHLTTLHAVVLALDTLCQAHDCCAEQLLAGSGIALHDLQRPQMRIAISQERQVFLNATQLCPDLGLELGRRMHVSSYGLLGFTLLAAPTLGAALQVAFSFPALLGTLFDLRLQDDGELAWIEAGGYREAAALQTFNSEFCLASLALICEDLLGKPLPVSEVQFEHGAPAYHEQYARNFPCPVRFDATRNAFAFPSHWLQKRLPLADTVTHRDTLERCNALNREFIGHLALVSRVRQLLASQLPDAPSPEQLARQLRCSTRTLRRQLQEVGSSYQALLDELRFEQARQLLAAERMPIARIAEQLGYSETASFRHAFQRWSGTSPSRFRRPAAR